MRSPSPRLLSLALALALAGCPTPDNPFGPPVTPPPGGSPALALRLGGPGDDRVRDVVVDGSGNTYVTGQFAGTVDFDPSGTTQALTSLGEDDVFLARYSPTGALAWAVRLGGSGQDSVGALALDPAGNLVLGGSYTGTADFDPTATTVAFTSNGGRDAWLASFSSAGTLRWARGFGGSADEAVLDVAAAGTGALYAAGHFSGTSPVDPGQGIAVISAGDQDGFLASWTAAGTLRWAISVGGTGADAAHAVATGAGGAVFLGGAFSGAADLAPGAATVAVISAGGTDGFVARYDEAGAVAWARGFGGPADDQVRPGGLAALADGSTYATGDFTGTADFDGGAAVLARTSLGQADGFVVRHGPDGALVWALTMGGAEDDAGLSAAVAANGGVIVTGAYGGTARFDPGAAATSLIARGSAGATELFVVRYSAAGSFAWAVGVGGAVSGGQAQGSGSGLAVDGSGNVVVGGSFYGSADVNPGSGLAVLTSLGGADGLVVKYTGAGGLALSP